MFSESKEVSVFFPPTWDNITGHVNMLLVLIFLSNHHVRTLSRTIGLQFFTILFHMTPFAAIETFAVETTLITAISTIILFVFCGTIHSFVSKFATQIASTLEGFLETTGYPH